MNNKTSKLIRASIEHRFPGDKDNKKRCRKAKRDWNSTPKNKRALSRQLLESFLIFDMNKVDFS